MISGSLLDYGFQGLGLKTTWFLSSRAGRREQVVALDQYITSFVAPPFYGALTNTIVMLRRIRVLSQRAYPLQDPSTIAPGPIALIKRDTFGTIFSHALM